jgi:hypothetical protein
VRLQRDVNKGTSNIGAILTGVFREKDADAFTGGVDYNLRWDRNRVVWNGHWWRRARRGRQSGHERRRFDNFNFSRKHYGHRRTSITSGATSASTTSVLPTRGQPQRRQRQRIWSSRTRGRVPADAGGLLYRA